MALERVSGVSRVDILDGQGDAGYTVCALRPKDGCDIREETARTIIQRGWPLRDLRLEHATLEEFFIQVTASQAMGKIE